MESASRNDFDWQCDPAAESNGSRNLDRRVRWNVAERPRTRGGVEASSPSFRRWTVWPALASRWRNTRTDLSTACRRLANPGKVFR